MLLAGTGNGVTPARRRVTDWMLKMEERVEFKKQRFREPGPALCSERTRARSVSAGVGPLQKGSPGKGERDRLYAQVSRAPGSAWRPADAP